MSKHTRAVRATLTRHLAFCANGLSAWHETKMECVPQQGCKLAVISLNGYLFYRYVVQKNEARRSATRGRHRGFKTISI